MKNEKHKSLPPAPSQRGGEGMRLQKLKIKRVAQISFSSSPFGGSPEGDGGRLVTNNSNSPAYET